MSLSGGLLRDGVRVVTEQDRPLRTSLRRQAHRGPWLARTTDVGHQRQIAATLGTSLTRIKPDARWVLRAAAHLAPTDIPRQLLLDMLAQTGTPDDQAEKTLAAALNDPHRDGLWTYSPGPELVSVHVLVSAAAAALENDRHLNPTLIGEAAIACLLRSFQTRARDNTRHPALTGLVPHAQHLTSSHQADPPTLALLGMLARYEYDAGRAALAANLYQKQLTGSERVLGAEHPATLASRNNLAGAYQAAGRLAEALPLYEQTLTDVQRLLGPGHPHTLASRGNLAGAYHDAGRLPEALPLYEQTLTDRERLLGPDHPDTLTSRNNLTRFLAAAAVPDGAPAHLDRTFLGRLLRRARRGE